MRLRTRFRRDLTQRVFWAAFLAAAAFMTAALVLGVRLAQDSSSLMDSPEVAAAFAEIAREAEKRDPSAETLLSAIQVVRRDYTRAAVLRTDVLVRTVLSVLLLAASGALAAFLFARLASSWATRRWRLLWEGLSRIQAGDRSYRFAAGHGDYGELGSRLNQLLDAFEERARVAEELKGLRSWGEAASYLAHQVRTPLASLALSATTAKERLSPERGDPELAAAIDRIESEAARLTEIVGRLKALSDFGDLSLEEVDPIAVIRSAAATVAARYRYASGTEVTVTHRSAEGVPVPRFDPRYLEQAFVNLLSNSAEAAAERGIPYTVRCTISATDTAYRISLEDGVTDLDPEAARRIGERRFTTKPQGSGLGVWLVGRVAALHGGTLTTGPSESGGLRVDLAFPPGTGGSPWRES